MRTVVDLFLLICSKFKKKQSSVAQSIHSNQHIQLWVDVNRSCTAVLPAIVNMVIMNIVYYQRVNVGHLTLLSEADGFLHWFVEFIVCVCVCVQNVNLKRIQITLSASCKYTLVFDLYISYGFFDDFNFNAIYFHTPQRL